MSAAPPRVHLPSGYLPVGQRHRAVCTCGWMTTPRATEDRALTALLQDHGWTAPICVRCGTDHRGYVGRDWAALRREVEILDDPAAVGGTILVCRGMPESCRDGAAQRQLFLDQAAQEAPETVRPRPQLRVVDGGAGL